MILKKFTIFTLILSISACSFSGRTIKGTGDLKLQQTSFDNLHGWAADDHAAALISFNNSCNKFESMGDTREVGGRIGNITVADFRDVCEIAHTIKGMSSAQAKNFFENWFVPFKISSKNGNARGLFTGYYVPELRGNRIKTEIYKYPVYARPKDLTSEPYLSRKEIENGALNGKNLEILYVDDKVDLFFLHVQGSGRVVLPDGVVVKLAFAGKNNQPYSSIGSYMKENKIMGKNNVSYDSIKSWLRNNPEKATEILNVNNSYIFFKVSGQEYVTGSQGVPLTPERSLAIDSDLIPYGYPIWVDTEAKYKKDKTEIYYQKLLVTQDSGSAIKGAVRGDIFFGKGKNAEIMAAQMNNTGSYYILLPANVVNKFGN